MEIQSQRFEVSTKRQSSVAALWDVRAMVEWLVAGRQAGI